MPLFCIEFTPSSGETERYEGNYGGPAEAVYGAMLRREQDVHRSDAPIQFRAQPYPESSLSIMVTQLSKRPVRGKLGKAKRVYT